MADNTTAVEQLYVEYFARPADYAGLQFWVNSLNADPNSIGGISAAFARSQEYIDTYAGQDNRQLVDTVYHNLFGRAAEAAGVDYWANLLDNHVITVDNMVAEIAKAAQGNDAFVFNGRVHAATLFTSHLDTPAEQAAYSGATANAMAKAFIGSIVDLQSIAAGADAGYVDIQIADIVGAHTSANAGHTIA